LLKKAAFVILCYVALAGICAVAQSETASSGSSASGDPQMSPLYPPGFLARIDQNSPKEVEQALKRAEELYFSQPDPLSIPTLSFVIHGPEVEIFVRDNYKKYKNINDLAARLTALGIINLRVCETRLSSLNHSKSSLFPFVGTVKLGPKEERRLIKKEKFKYF